MSKVDIKGTECAFSKRISTEKKGGLWIKIFPYFKIISTLLNSTKYRFQYLEYLHFPLWIIKDTSWFISLHYESYATVFQKISLLFALPTILILLYLIRISKEPFKRFKHSIIGTWLVANSLWMVSELFEVPLSIGALLFFALGLVLTLFWIAFQKIIFLSLFKLKTYEVIEWKLVCYNLNCCCVWPSWLFIRQTKRTP